ncbi:hypothetical protein B0H12DRAFT_1229842 [Mycena haematopus]|nr:hypothetical protein B0H12DRAFT_1229842 [Mycena haematopus]
MRELEREEILTARMDELAGAAASKSETKRQSFSPSPYVTHSSDHELESEEDEDVCEPYPLEGMYIDEEDRAKLLSMRELEREEILTARMDELERIRDRHWQHITKLQRAQFAGAAAASGQDKTRDKTLSALKARRMAKYEKEQRDKALRALKEALKALRKAKDEKKQHV